MSIEASPAGEIDGKAASSDLSHYDRLAVILHWATAVLVLTQFGLAELWDFAPRPIKHLMVVAHISSGMLLALVVAVRIVWRLTPGHRVRDVEAGLAELTAKTVHFALYGLLAAEVTLGILLRWSGGEALSFFGLLIPSPLAEFSKPAQDRIGSLHDWLAWTIVILAAGHATMALIHHFVLRDTVLWRMLPGQRARMKALDPSS
jgi:cytochrome b561